jgi:hypothetical protein
VRKWLAALAAMAGLAHAGTAVAGTFLLLSPNRPVTAPPPLKPGAPIQPGSIEIQNPGTVESRQLVDVGIGSDGTTVSVTATQVLRIVGTGDYSFLVPAPVTGVVPGPGSESLPGLRDVGILWQGFSNRHRVLSAKATLRPKDAAVGLPLRISFERRDGATAVRLENVTHRRVSVVACCATRAAVIAALRKMRAASEPLRIAGADPFVTGVARKGASTDVAAPLRVTGVLSVGAQRTNVDEVLGGGRPPERTFVIRGAAAPRLRLHVDFLAPIAMLPLPRDLAHGPRPLVRLQVALGAIATSLSYRRFLATPDPNGKSQASYVYRSVPRPAAIVAPKRRDDGDDTLAIVLGLALGAAALAGLAVLWARS